MLIKGKVKGETYQKLMEYLINKSNIFEVAIHTEQYIERTNRYLKIFLNGENCTLKDLAKNYSKEYLEYMAEKYKDNIEIYGKEVYNFTSPDGGKRAIKDHINWIYYNYITSEFVNKYKEEMILKKVSDPSYTRYFFKLSDRLKKEILSKNSVSDWMFPYSVEDIMFYNDKDIMYVSETHENMFDVYCKNKKEYNYFKKMGIKFYEKYTFDGENGLDIILD